MRATSHDRLAAETGEEREARLQQMRDCSRLLVFLIYAHFNLVGINSG